MSDGINILKPFSISYLKYSDVNTSVSIGYSHELAKQSFLGKVWSSGF